jgi:hypothetical protein
MKPPNYSRTADYFERRAAKAAGERRRAHLVSVARLYREKARGAGASADDSSASETSASAKRERVAAMFRALGDPSSIARSRKRALDESETV